MNEKLQMRKPYGLGLQVPLGMDNEVSLSGTWRRRWSAMPRISARNSDQQGDKEMMIYAGSINRDHAHMLISIPPQLSVSRAVQYLKGKSSYRLLREYKTLRKRYWGQHLWARGYWVASRGNVTDEVWKDYIKSQKLAEPDDDFTVV